MFTLEQMLQLCFVKPSQRQLAFQHFREVLLLWLAVYTVPVKHGCLSVTGALSQFSSKKTPHQQQSQKQTYSTEHEISWETRKKKKRNRKKIEKDITKIYIFQTELTIQMLSESKLIPLKLSAYTFTEVN